MAIVIRECRNYLSEVDLLAIENNVASLGIHSLIFSDYLTEEQKQENQEQSKLLTREQWAERCDQHQRKVGIRIESLIDAINTKFVLYQYKNHDISYSKDNWDLYFYSNQGWNGNDYMNYARLSPNNKRSIEQQLSDINNVLNLLKTIDCESIEVAIQYKAIYNETKVKDIVLSYCKQIKDQFINYNGMNGKIKEIGLSNDGVSKYGFFKKGASKNYYEINETAILKSVLS